MVRAETETEGGAGGGEQRAEREIRSDIDAGAPGAPTT